MNSFHGRTRFNGAQAVFLLFANFLFFLRLLLNFQSLESLDRLFAPLFLLGFGSQVRPNYLMHPVVDSICLRWIESLAGKNKWQVLSDRFDVLPSVSR